MILSRFKELVRNGVANPEQRSCVYGKDAAPAPDYTPMANASEHAANVMRDLGQQQINLAKEQYADAKPILTKIAQQQIDIANTTKQQADDYYKYQTETYRPVEKSLVADALNYSTEAKQNELAAKAAADVGRAYTATTESTNRALAQMGVNPNSGRFISSARKNDLGISAARAGAMTGARQNAEQIGYARKLDAAGLGRNLAGASQGAYGVAINSGNSAGVNTQSPGQALLNGTANGNATIGNGLNMQLSGLGNILGNQTSMATNGNSGAGMMAGGAMSMIGNLGSSFMSSDRRLKENVELVGVDEATGLNLYEFNYIGSPHGRYRGVMADEVADVMPEAVVYDGQGFAAVDYSKLGFAMEKIQ